uniref:Chorein N-terminal domain-containing protein n=1 Tax=Borely moumouvirus TaxID=2712067 RepID=A0A6G6ABW8_9VIRU
MEWLKNICLMPIRLGLDKTNILAMNLITMVFNIYGKKILKTESDKIIDYHQCIGDFDIFHLYPLYFKESEYDFFSNYFKIKNGVINGLLLEFPWKSMLQDNTKIKINDIYVEINMFDFNSSITKSLFESQNSYLQNNIVEDNEITEVYHGIDNMLKKYFSGISVEISSIKLVLIDHFIIYLNDCNYHNNCLKINNLVIHSYLNEEKILLQVKNIQINKNKDEYDISLQSLIFSFHFLDHLPILKIIPDSNKINYTNFKITLKIFELIFDKLILKNLTAEINIGPTFSTIIKDISSISIDNTLLINFNKISEKNNLMEIYENKCVFNTQIKCKISNFKLLNIWFNETKKFVHGIEKKFIFNESNTPSKIFNLDNIKLLVLYGDDIWQIDAKNIIFDEIIFACDIKYLHQNIMGKCEKILIDNNSYKIINIFAKSEEFLSKSKTIIIKTVSGINIDVFDLDCNNIISLGKYILSLINLFTYPKNNDPINELENKPKNILSFHNSKIYHEYEKNNYALIIHKIDISLTEKYAQDIFFDLLINNYLVSRISASKLSSEFLEIKSIKIFLDIDIIDILANLLGLIIPENNDNMYITQNLPEDVLDKLQNALENSIFSRNMDCLEEKTNEITKSIMEKNVNMIENPIIRILSESLINLDSLLVCEYSGQKNNFNIKKKIQIESCHVYLHHKLSNINTKTISSAFMCLILKNIRGTYSLNENITQKYKFYSEKIAIVDINSRDPCWKYFLKFTGNNAVMFDISKYKDTIKINININPFCLNIREETLIKLLSFFSNISIKTVNDTPIFIEKFSMNEINTKINYYPIMLEKIDAGTNNLFIKNYNLIVPAHVIKNVDGFNKLGLLIKNNLEKVINPNNVVQFVPNIKLVKPYAMPINNLILMINKYFNSSSNKKKLRKITKNINQNTTSLSNLILLKLKNIFYGIK